MKNYLLWLPVGLTAIITTIYHPVKEAIAEKPVEKSILFTVYKGNNYAAEVYNYTSAQVHITVEKVRGTRRTTVWEKTFDAKLLKQYPSIDQALSQKINISILDKKELLEVKYVLTYNSKGSELQMQNGTIVSKGESTGKLDISI